MADNVDLLIRGARLVDARSEQGVRDVAIAGGVIQAIESEIAGGQPGKVIDADGLLVMPGVVDSHVHMTELSGGGFSSRSPAHERLARAGVTSAVEFFDFRTVLDQWHSSAAGLTVLGLQCLPSYQENIPASRIRDDIGAALRSGSIGVKLLGGHFPSTPDASAQAIAEAAAIGAYIGFHAGTTANGSDLDGMREALELADGQPLHLAHTNAYLRGATADLVAENETGLSLLRTHGQVVSEAHLAPLNICAGKLSDGHFVDHIVVNCLRLGGYAPDPAGLAQAFLDEYAYYLHHLPNSATPLTGRVGHDLWREDPEHSALCFPVNRRLSGFMQACARIDESETTRYEGPGDFIVDAISSDGGYWRNLILRQGLTLVKFGALTLCQLAYKTSMAPAALFGIHGKGKLAPGADADIVGIDLERDAVRFTVAAGQIVYDGEHVLGRGGTVLTTEHGVDAIRERGIPYRLLDLSESVFARRGRQQRSAGTGAPQRG